MEAARAAVLAGADFIGFVFAESRRKISPEEAAEIARYLPVHIWKVGVFVNERPDRMVEIAERVKLDYLQLHGDESAELAKLLPYKIIRAFSVEQINLQELENFPCDFYLIDSPKGKYRVEMANL